LSDQATNEDTPTTPQAFTITDMDSSNIQISVQSSETSLIALSDISFTSNNSITSSGNTYTVTLSSNTASVYIQETPTTNSSGSSIITVTVTDGNASSSSSFTVTVNAVNDLPTIDSISDQTINEDTEMSPVSFAVSDTENEALTVSVSTGNTSIIALSSSNITLSNAAGGIPQ
ncbi:hypothetical protein MHK_000405, partial [Candidatus Magnetomorum sp. HK-1]